MKTKHAGFGLGLLALSVGAFAGSFDGWQASAGMDVTHARTTGAEIYDVNGTDTGDASGDGTHSRTGLKAGVAYGFSVGQIQTTVGLDYVGANNAIANAPDGSGGLNSLNVSRRADLYVAPGYQIDRDSVIYAKLAYSALSYNGMSNSTTGALSGTPGNYAVTYGLGFKQKFGPNSPLFYAVEYTTGSTGSKTITDVNGDNFSSQLKLSSVGLSLGYVFN